MRKKPPPDLQVALLSLPDPKARNDLQAFIQVNTNPDWTKISTISIHEAQNEKLAGKPVRIHAAVSYVSEPEPTELTLDGKRVTTIKFSLIDPKDSELRCVDVPYDKFGEKILRCYNQKAYYIFTGTILSVINNILSFPINYYTFYLTGIEEELSAIDLIKLSAKDVARAEKIINKHASDPGGIFGYIKNTLVKKLGITGLDRATQLSKCIDYKILQSLSEGIYKNNSMKLHSLVIGAPGEGKKLLTIIAKILNPVFEEVPSVKVTNAGLIGRAVSSGGVTRSIPGYLPRASGGVLCFQDFHENNGNKGREIKATLAQAMEDGLVIDGTSAMTRHEATASIHADLNKLSQVLLSNGIDIFHDINIRTNLLSRFDLIMDIPPDKMREFEVALSMVKNIGEIKTSREFVSLPRWQQDLRAIIAVMRTNYKNITVSPTVEKYIRLKLIKIYGSGILKELPSGMMTRLAVSITKFAVVTARANLRNRVFKKDIDLAFGFIDYKLDFLSKLKSKTISNIDSHTGITAKEKRRNLIKISFAGQIVTCKQIHGFITNSKLDSVCKKTISRDLKAVGKPSGKKWQIS